MHVNVSSPLIPCVSLKSIGTIEVLNAGSTKYHQDNPWKDKAEVYSSFSMKEHYLDRADHQYCLGEGRVKLDIYREVEVWFEADLSM